MKLVLKIFFLSIFIIGCSPNKKSNEINLYSQRHYTVDKKQYENFEKLTGIKVNVVKANTDVVEEMQTLYSFRHSGAIDIFKRTGSITKLQKAMGHSSINVSLTYLRGLEVPELNEEDMPMI